MRREATGRHELTSTAGEAVRASCWRPLPADPPVVLHGPLQVRHERALLTCSHLDGVSTLLPDPELFLDAYLRREALLSSRIEATEPLWARQPSPERGVQDMSGGDLDSLDKGPLERVTSLFGRAGNRQRPGRCC